MLQKWLVFLLSIAQLQMLLISSIQPKRFLMGMIKSSRSHSRKRSKLYQLRTTILSNNGKPKAIIIIPTFLDFETSIASSKVYVTASAKKKLAKTIKMS
jgi:hypothetical protein